MNAANTGRIVLVLGRAIRKTIVEPRDAALRARMAWWVVLISALARLTSLPRAQRLVSAHVRPRRLANDSDAVARLARAIDSVLRIDLFVFRRSCWKRAMVLHRFLAANGIESRINFGVRKGIDGSVKGHAWLERRGQPFLEDAAGSYVVTFTLPRRRDDREMRLLIECARASIEPQHARRICEIAASGVRWDRLLRLAQRHGLAPLLYFHLSRICAASVPTGVLESLRDYFHKNSAFSLLLTGELVRLLDLLKAEGIEAIPYKGPAIAAKLYGHVALRQFCDLDLLVRERDVWHASRVMQAQGFAPHYLIPEEKRAAFVRHDYVQLFRRDAGRTMVEVHWRIAPRFFAVRFDADAMWPRLEPMPLQGATVLMPCAEDLLLMLCVHGARHGWDKLEAVSSIAELLRRTPDLDWARAWQRSREMHCRRMLAFGLLLAHRLFDSAVPPQAMAMIQSRALQTIADRIVLDLSADEPPPRTFAELVAHHLRLKDSRLDQARHCVRLALTPNPNDWAAVRLRGPLSFAYPFVRAVRLAREYGPLPN